MASAPPVLPGLPQPQAAQPPQVTDEQDSGVTPEEQAQYSEFEENYMRLIYDKDQVRPELLEALKAGFEGEGAGEATGEGPPAYLTALANTAVRIVAQIDDAARDAGRPLSDDVLFQGGAAVIEELVEVSEAADLHDYTQEEMSGALTLAVDMYREKAVQDGRTDEETLVGEWDKVVAADQQGRVGEVVPGLTDDAPAGEF